MEAKSINVLTDFEVCDRLFWVLLNSTSTKNRQSVHSGSTLNFAKQFFKEFKKTLKKITALPKTKKTILIAEDEELNFLYLRTILSNQNFNLLRANNGKEAVEICNSNSDIDLILMDIKMPIMNGFEATSRIKKFRSDVPIIAQTALSTTNDRNRAFNSGCSDFISKPFTQDDLLEKIASHI